MQQLADITKYGSLYAKVHVMRRNLFSEEQYRDLMSRRSVSEAAAFLKSTPSYREVLSDSSESTLHREALEHILYRSYMQDVVKLHRFDHAENKEFYAYVYMRVEIELLKNILRRLGNAEMSPWAFDVPDFFAQHFSIDLQDIARSKSIPEFLQSLSGSRYESVIAPLLTLREHQNLAGVEMTLDLSYYDMVEKLRLSLADSADKKVLAETVGAEVDALNLLWIYRCKKYFRTPSELIYAFLIPNHYKLSEATIIHLTETSDETEFLKTVRTTPYRDIFVETESGFFDRNLSEYLCRLHHKAARKYPYSIEAVVSYLYLKKTEIHNITSIIEGIRYGLSAEQIAPYIVGVTASSSVGSHR